MAERAARAAGELLLERFGGPARGLGSKTSSTDMVSDADRAAEEAIVALLRAERPDDGLMAEEGASLEGSSGRRWVIDPLDGTTNFLYGNPQWAVSVAIEDGEGVLAGVVLDPVRGECFRAERGGGCTLLRYAQQSASTSEEPLRVREGASLSRALIATGFGYEAAWRREQAKALAHILPRVRDVRRGGAAALDLSWVAAGRLDGYWERGLNPWDWAAGRLLVTEAGGALAEPAGERQGLVAAAPELLPELVELVTEAERLAAT
ncbi:MAG: inositol monophosphatase [Actinomycetota bacterium]|nr:inositol monophosphatase [Actinomycetota bacterium]